MPGGLRKDDGRPPAPGGGPGETVAQPTEFSRATPSPHVEAGAGDDPVEPRGEVPTAFPRVDGYHVIGKLGQGGMGAVSGQSHLNFDPRF